ncbi:MAG: hypothetical protein K6G88_07805 [Lachnospiraceae bacterium]|nr:hypothetical protein [Lachnospiraceae bacterium]
MDFLIEEHGDALKCSVISLLVVAVTIISIGITNKITPIFNTNIYYRNMVLSNEFKKYSPAIKAEYAVYAEKGKPFDLFSVVSVTDYDGSDISKRALTEGSVDVNKEGLQYVVVSVTNQKGFTVSKRINVLVE